jgi:predicted RNase H-like nuclease
MGAALSRQLASLGYPIATTATPAGTAHCLVEVYPHPALLVMLGRNFRVPYKVTNASKYWKGASVRERIGKLLVEFADVARGLKEHIDNIPLKLPLADEVASLSALKRHEDALDALVCCWVGASFMAGKAYPLGDETAAVWCPHP